MKVNRERLWQEPIHASNTFFLRFLICFEYIEILQILINLTC